MALGKPQVREPQDPSLQQLSYQQEHKWQSET